MFLLLPLSIVVALPKYVGLRSLLPRNRASYFFSFHKLCPVERKCYVMRRLWLCRKRSESVRIPCAKFGFAASTSSLGRQCNMRQGSTITVVDSRSRPFCLQNWKYCFERYRHIALEEAEWRRVPLRNCFRKNSQTDKLLRAERGATFMDEAGR